MMSILSFQPTTKTNLCPNKKSSSQHFAIHPGNCIQKSSQISCNCISIHRIRPNQRTDTHTHLVILMFFVSFHFISFLFFFYNLHFCSFLFNNTPTTKIFIHQPAHFLRLYALLHQVLAARPSTNDQIKLFTTNCTKLHTLLW